MTALMTKSRKDRLIHERVHDPYKPARKPREPSVCPVCNVVFQGGRWQWLESWPTTARKEICQACQRIRDDYPAGIVTLSGDFANSHRIEILNLIRNQEKAERTHHPMHRFIKVDEQPDKIVISTTDLHLPKRIGEALHRAYKGRLELRYEKKGCFVRVKWTSKLEESKRDFKNQK